MPVSFHGIDHEELPDHTVKDLCPKEPNSGYYDSDKGLHLVNNGAGRDSLSAAHMDHHPQFDAGGPLNRITNECISGLAVVDEQGLFGDAELDEEQTEAGSGSDRFSEKEIIELLSDFGGDVPIGNHEKLVLAVRELCRRCGISLRGNEGRGRWNKILSSVPYKQKKRKDASA